MTSNWPSSYRSVVDWLANGTVDERFIDRIFVEMCTRLNAAGVPVDRATLFLDTHNPQWLGTRIFWVKGMDGAELNRFDYDVQSGPAYLNSPMFVVNEGAPEVRARLRDLSPDDMRYPIYDDLLSEGYTDYVIWPLKHTLGKQHIVSFASRATKGFSDEAMAYLRDVLPLLALVSEVRLKNRLARTYLETYVGPHASEQILAGATTRGSGFTVSAAIMICDLRDFTAISDAWPRDDVIGLLNGYFDAMADPIAAHGGEILKFMGDGLLAIFELSRPDACLNLLRAIKDAQAALAGFGADNAARGRPALRYGIGVHAGDVMYGNIGTRSRLDFTAIGPAVNIASRLETLTKEIGRPVLLSKAFVEAAGYPAHLEPLGRHHLRGLGDALDVYGFAGDRVAIG